MSSPKEQQTLPMLLPKAYIQDFGKTKQQAAIRTLKFLDEEAENARQSLYEAEKQLADFSGTYQIWKFSGKIGDQITRMEESRNLYRNMTFREKDLSMMVRALKNSGLSSQELSFQTVFDRRFKEGIEELVRLRTLRSFLSRKLTEDHPQMKYVGNLIEMQTQHMQQSLDRTLEIFRLKEELIEEEYNKILEESGQMPSLEQQLEKLDRLVRIREVAYLASLEKRAEAAISAMSDETYHVINEIALKPEKVLKPRPVISTVLGGLMGILYCAFGIHIVLLILGRIVRESDLVVHFRLPLLASLKKSLPGLPEDQDYINLAFEYFLRKDSERLIGFLAARKREHPELIARKLARAFGILGENILIVNARSEKSQQRLISKQKPEGVDYLMHDLVPFGAENHEDWDLRIETWIKHYDRVLIILPDISEGIQCRALVHVPNEILLSTEKGISGISASRKAERLLREENVGNAALLYVEEDTLWKRFLLKFIKIKA